MLSGQRIDATLALEMGLAWKLVPEPQLLAEAQSFCDETIRGFIGELAPTIHLDTASAQ